MKRLKHALPDLKEARNRKREETRKNAFTLAEVYKGIGTGKTLPMDVKVMRLIVRLSQVFLNA